MRFLHCLLLLVTSFSLLPIVSAQQPMDIGDVVWKREGVRPIAVDSTDASIAKLARRAFGLHGGCVVTTPSKSAYVFNIERASGSSVTLSISSGGQEQLRRTVLGRDLQNAVLRACDMAVEATLHTKGFFAGKLAFVGKQRGVSEVYTADLLFNRVRPLTADRALVTGPSWSPDGTKLLYTTYYKSGFPDIYMMDLNSGRKSPVATYEGTNTGGAYSPNGRSIAMSLSSSGSAEIFMAESIGKKPRRLTTNKSLETSPTWSPDGRRLAFTSDARGKPQIYEVPVNGGPMRRIPTNVSSYCSEPAWNPVKENLIAFTAAVSGGFQIAVYDSEQQKSDIVTTVTESAVEPTWLNDGRHLVFTQRQSGRTRLMLLDTETKKISALHVPDFGDASSASFVY
ncbi:MULTISPECIES: PD40 domain-containing protein [unclassified Lentimonas]|uniref:PD40 domain-containing protein n=1 Tax=unclassified Lentimonas TaxID=2630993 RepID=UPI0013895FDD|nr:MULTISPECIES: PD40 domain-containing protein [unclassified Lentimonas]